MVGNLWAQAAPLGGGPSHQSTMHDSLLTVQGHTEKKAFRSLLPLSLAA